MAGHKHLDPFELGWRENRENVNLRGRQVLRRVLNEALNEVSNVYWEAAADGKVVKIDFSDAELEKLLLDHANRELGK